jgi:hypothetical protein
MNIDNLWIKFVGEKDQMCPFHLNVCNLIIREIEDRREPIINTLLWLKNDEEGQLPQYFKIGDDRHDDYDIDAVIFSVLGANRRISRFLTDEEMRYIHQKVRESGTRSRTPARGRVLGQIASEFKLNKAAIYRAHKKIERQLNSV